VLQVLDRLGLEVWVAPRAGGHRIADGTNASLRVWFEGLVVGQLDPPAVTA